MVALPTNLKECRRKLALAKKALKEAEAALDGGDKDKARQIISQTLGALG
jgi:hypothetical protein